MPIIVNVAGQVGQIKLSVSKALWPLFETVINSIQSLEDSNVPEKKIIIEALRPEHAQFKTGGESKRNISKFYNTSNVLLFGRVTTVRLFTGKLTSNRGTYLPQF